MSETAWPERRLSTARVQNAVGRVYVQRLVHICSACGMLTPYVEGEGRCHCGGELSAVPRWVPE